MKEYTKQEAIRVVTECSTAYCKELLDQCLLFVTTDKHRRTRAIEVHFLDRNYAHLTGLVLDKKVISGSRFLEMCTSRKLSPMDFEFRPDGTTYLKLNILPYLMTKNLSANIVGDYNGVGFELYTEKIAGSVKGCVEFCVDDITKDYVPNTVLKTDIRDCTNNPQERIVATFHKRKDDEKYSEIVYHTKKVDWGRVNFPAEYEYLQKLIKR